MKIAFIDTIGLPYTGETLHSQGLGGSESAVIYMAEELSKLGFSVTVLCNCPAPGQYSGVRYLDVAQPHGEQYDIVVVSRTTAPFIDSRFSFIHLAKLRVLWMHDTFVGGDENLERLTTSRIIDRIFTLSDWHTNYITTCTHGPRRNFEVLKRYIYQTRNGIRRHCDVKLSEKDSNLFVYNASATKGMVPLVERIWPRVKQQIPDARLVIIGGYYRFGENADPDAQEQTVRGYMSNSRLSDLGIEFTGVIPQQKVARLLAKASFTIYPGAFPETFGISTLESLAYQTPVITCRFGALEETAIDTACYKLDYAIEPNSLYPHIDGISQENRFVELVVNAHKNHYLLQQKQQYCRVVDESCDWSAVALEWKAYFYKQLGAYLDVDSYRRVRVIGQKVSRIFGRQFNLFADEFIGPITEREIVVVSPVRNAESYIRNCILSVAQQDYNSYTHIIIDDASTDNTAAVISETIVSLPEHIRTRFKLVQNNTRLGAIQNQLTAIDNLPDDSIVILLDGDDRLVCNPTIFKLYNQLYEDGYEFTYGSMWSDADQIPLIAQPYTTTDYRNELFAWKIPYTHLRTCLAKYFKKLDKSHFKVDNKWMMSGADNPLFYELIEQIEPSRVYANPEIVVYYNDLNPLNDYKIHAEEQTRNANMSYEKKKILIAIPTNRYIEPETFKSIFDLKVPDGYELVFQYFYGYQIDQIRNLIADWGKHYDYVFSVDSDIIVPSDALIKLIAANKPIVTGLYIQRKPDQHILEIYGVDGSGSMYNIPYDIISQYGLVEIAACGMGCALINSRLFREIPYPHFVYTSALDHKNTVSEDVYFCMRARDHGFGVWCDPSILCDHKGSTYFKVRTQEADNIDHVYSQDLLPATHVEYLHDIKSKPAVVYDIGSCVLHWQRHAANTWPDARIICFDANRALKSLYDKLGVEYWLGVLTHSDGIPISFYKEPMNLGGSSYYREATDSYKNTTPTHETGATLDSVVKNNSFPLPDMIKLDVQGAELDVLKGATRCLSNCTDIILEAQHVDYNIGAPKIDDIIKFLDNLGFTLVSNFTKHAVDGDYHFTKTRK